MKLRMLALLLVILPAAACADTHQATKTTPSTRLVHVSWQKSNSDPIGYNVYRISCGKRLFKAAGAVKGTCPGKVELVGFTNKDYINDFVLADSTYEYYATTLDAYGVESAPSETILFTVDPHETK